MIDLTDWNYAEPIFWFVEQDGIKQDYLDKKSRNPLSRLEYVDKYKRDEFLRFLDSYAPKDELPKMNIIVSASEYATSTYRYEDLLYDIVHVTKGENQGWEVWLHHPKCPLKMLAFDLENDDVSFNDVANYAVNHIQTCAEQFRREILGPINENDLERQ